MLLFFVLEVMTYYFGRIVLVDDYNYRTEGISVKLKDENDREKYTPHNGTSRLITPFYHFYGFLTYEFETG